VKAITSISLCTFLPLFKLNLVLKQGEFRIKNNVMKKGRQERLRDGDKVGRDKGERQLIREAIILQETMKKRAILLPPKPEMA
jgi:hypothetical protein